MTVTQRPRSSKNVPAGYFKTLAPLDEASTLPPMCYTSKEFFDLEIERIFMKEWISAGRIDEIPNRGDYFTLTLFGEPLVVCRDKDGKIHCMSTVCRHRGMEVVEGKGNRKSFQCPYHLWTYGLNGELLGAPLMDDAKGFDWREVRLPRLLVEEWEGFIFVNFDLDAAPLGPMLAPVSAVIKNYRMAEMISRVFDERICPFNWKMMAENFMEFYHAMGLHKGLHDPMPTELSQAADYNDTYAYARGYIPAEGGTLWSETGLNSPLPVIQGLNREEKNIGHFYLIFPHTLFLLSAELGVYFRVLPVAPDRMNLRVYSLYSPETAKLKDFENLAKQVEDLFLLIHQQDMWACGSMQRGVSGPLSRRDNYQGRFSSWEKVCHNIGRYVLSRTGIA